MREIKFRAWSIEGRQFLHNISMLCDGSGWLSGFVWINGDEIHCDLKHPDDAVIMQYTGLKDKYENPIYEGDIVKIDYIDGGFVGEVCWCKLDGAWLVSVENYMLGTIKEAYREVIGNLHENPELLE